MRSASAPVLRSREPGLPAEGSKCSFRVQGLGTLKVKILKTDSGSLLTGIHGGVLNPQTVNPEA